MSLANGMVQVVLVLLQEHVSLVALRNLLTRRLGDSLISNSSRIGHFRIFKSMGVGCGHPGATFLGTWGLLFLGVPFLGWV